MKIVRAHINLEGSPVSLQLGFPKFLLFFVVLFKRTVQLSLLILVLNLVAQRTYMHFLETAQEQRVNLYSRLQNINLQIDSLDTKISKTYGNEDLLYAKFGLAVQDTAAREMGFGGSVPSDSALVWSATPLKGLKSLLSHRFDRIEAKIERSHSSYLNLQSYIGRLQENLLHIPSIAPAEGFLSSAFGARTHPVTGEHGVMHMGIDVSAPKWTAIRAPANGYVDKVADSETLGKYVSIDHGNGIVTRYGHMVKPFTKEGQMVKRFDVIGYIGSTGRSTGNHLHYEVWVNDVAVNPVYYILPDQYSVE
jgi:murein DD-endopeptidase MepM/ murein hydrolase activator NlpD